MLALLRKALAGGRRAFSREGIGEQKRGLLRVFQAGGKRVFDDALHALCQILIQIKFGVHLDFLVSRLSLVAKSPFDSCFCV